MMWTLDSALAFIRSIQGDMMARGWFVALAGGCLNKGNSNHDLDLVAVPMKTYATDLEALHDVLRSHKLRRTHTWQMMIEHWSTKGRPDKKYVEVYFTDDHKRVDIIVAYPEGK